MTHQRDSSPLDHPVTRGMELPEHGNFGELFILAKDGKSVEVYAWCPNKQEWARIGKKDKDK